MDLGDKGKISKYEIFFDDGYLFFKVKIVICEQIVVKYFNMEIIGMFLVVINKLEKLVFMKM